MLNSTKVGGEPYRRFRAEVGVLRRLTDPGVLPLLDSHLPDRLSGDDPAWLAMPIATPLDEALAESPLAQTIEACATIADTLARLRRDHQLGHRDIKPGNLYEHDGHWLVGDFGLVADPSSDAITEGNRPLGPRHFCASEMVLRPAHADPGPADVYSLAKTLWVSRPGSASHLMATRPPTFTLGHWPLSERIRTQRSWIGSLTERRTCVLRTGQRWNNSPASCGPGSTLSCPKRMSSSRNRWRVSARR